MKLNIRKKSKISYCQNWKSWSVIFFMIGTGSAKGGKEKKIEGGRIKRWKEGRME